MNQMKFNKDLKGHKIHIIGDFNFDLIKFTFHAPTEKFIELIYGFGCAPTITKPTRIHNTSNTLIDNIFTSSNSIGVSVIVKSDLFDHNLTLFLRGFPSIVKPIQLKNRYV